MASTINLDNMEWEELMERARKATLNPGAALNAVHGLGEDGRAELLRIMKQQLPKAYGEGTKGMRVRGALVRKAKAMRFRNRKAAVAMWTLAAAKLDERHEALALFAAGRREPMVALPAEALSLVQLEAVNTALREDGEALLALLQRVGFTSDKSVGSKGPILSVVSEDRKVFVTIVTTSFEPGAAFRNGGIDEVTLSLSGGRDPIRLPHKMGQLIAQLVG